MVSPRASTCCWVLGACVRRKRITSIVALLSLRSPPAGGTVHDNRRRRRHHRSDRGPAPAEDHSPTIRVNTPGSSFCFSDRAERAGHPPAGRGRPAQRAGRLPRGLRRDRAVHGHQAGQTPRTRAPTVRTHNSTRRRFHQGRGGHRRGHLHHTDDRRGRAHVRGGILRDRAPRARGNPRDAVAGALQPRHRLAHAHLQRGQAARGAHAALRASELGRPPRAGAQGRQAGGDSSGRRRDTLAVGEDAAQGSAGPEQHGAHSDQVGARRPAGRPTRRAGRRD